ncbi:MAG: endonuclease/exonuclease/phosphatase family protein [Verrucomicrobiota bacterium]|nr:endonuclease/exonuclease/phosphatase family protein [Verrucomicrobiota bacterium]
MAEPNARRLRVATYNVHGCVGMDRKRSEARIAEVITSLAADVVALQELDLGRVRSAGVDQAQLLAAQLGWHPLFEPAMRNGDEQYGNAIISRYPLTRVRALELPGHGSWYCREKRIALWARAETEIGPVQIVNTHFALGRAERFLQAKFLAESLGALPPNEPLVLLGDFNSLPGSRSIGVIRNHLRSARALFPSAGPCRTFPTRFPSVAVDHIFMNESLDVASLSVPRSSVSRVASDHYPLVTDLVRSSL